MIRCCECFNESFNTSLLSAFYSGIDIGMELKVKVPNFFCEELLSQILETFEFLLKCFGAKAILKDLTLLCARLRPFLAKVDDGVRGSTLRLFAQLIDMVDSSSGTTADVNVKLLQDQLHAILMNMLVLLNDSSATVVRETCTTLSKSSKVLKFAYQNDAECVDVGSTTSSPRVGPGTRSGLQYSQCVQTIAKDICKMYPDKVSFYITSLLSLFRSESAQVRANAAVVLGIMLGGLESFEKEKVPYDASCSALLLLLQDSNELVRKKTAESMTYLIL
eukprot:Nk52_evm106s151 gene=Nk52_evmTU106s151